MSAPKVPPRVPARTVVPTSLMARLTDSAGRHAPPAVLMVTAFSRDQAEHQLQARGLQVAARSPVAAAHGSAGADGVPPDTDFAGMLDYAAEDAYLRGLSAPE